MANDENAGLWRTLNSPIVILLISAVIIGGLGFLIKNQIILERDESKQRASNALVLRSLSSELIARARRLETISEGGGDSDAWREALVKAQAVYYGRDQSRGSRSYESRSVSDLLLEFDRVAGLPQQTLAVNRFERMLSTEGLAKRDLPRAAFRLRYCVTVRINALGRDELPFKSAGERKRAAGKEHDWYKCAA
jgi:hypothetical protein